MFGFEEKESLNSLIQAYMLLLLLLLLLPYLMEDGVVQLYFCLFAEKPQAFMSLTRFSNILIKFSHPL